MTTMKISAKGTIYIDDKHLTQKMQHTTKLGLGTEDSTSKTPVPKVCMTLPEYMITPNFVVNPDDKALSSGSEWLRSFDDFVSSSDDDECLGNAEGVPDNPRDSAFEEWSCTPNAYKAMHLDDNYAIIELLR